VRAFPHTASCGRSGVLVKRRFTLLFGEYYFLCCHWERPISPLESMQQKSSGLPPVSVTEPRRSSWAEDSPFSVDGNEFKGKGIWWDRRYTKAWRSHCPQADEGRGGGCGDHGAAHLFGAEASACDRRTIGTPHGVAKRVVDKPLKSGGGIDSLVNLPVGGSSAPNGGFRVLMDEEWKERERGKALNESDGGREVRQESAAGHA